MKQICESFKNFLEEAAKNVDDLVQDNLVVYLEETPDQREAKFYLETRGGQLIAEIEIEFLPVASTNKYVTKVDYYGNCLGAYQVTWSESHRDGYGPPLYDLAMEYATSAGTGLTCDRAVVSEDAYKVWKYYLDNRSDVAVAQLDDMNNTLTPTDKDNCVQMSAQRMKSMHGLEDFPESPLSKVFRKTNNNVMKALKDQGRLVAQHTQDAMDYVDDYGDQY